MMKRLQKRVLAFFVCALTAISVCLPAQAQGGLYDGYIARAQDKGWLAAAGIDPAFPPEGGITYESLIIMVCEAMGIKPWYSIDYFLNYTYEKHSLRASEPGYVYKTFADARDTRMNEQGHLRIATQFGLLVLSDYCDFPDGGFLAEDRWQEYREKSLEPYRAALRGDAVMLITRGLGLVNSAAKRDTSAALFSDWDAVPDWEKGCVGELCDAGVLTADGHSAVRVGDPISLGEACEMLCKAYDFMTEGIDEMICVEYFFYTGHAMLAWLPVPVQIVDGLIYIPIRTYYQTGMDLNRSYPATPTMPETFHYGWWSKKDQAYKCEYGNGYPHYYYAGQSEYLCRRGVDNDCTALGPARLLFGEVMFPIMQADDARFSDGVVHIEVSPPMHMSS